MYSTIPFSISLFLCMLLASLNAEAQSRVLNSDDFRITAEEEKLVKDLGGAVAQPNAADSRTVFEKVGLIQSPLVQKKWEKYLREVENSSLEMEKIVFERVFRYYQGALVAYGSKLKECNTEIKDSSWLEDLKKKFGEKYVKEHRSDIKAILFYLQMERQWNCLDEQRKYLLQAEWLYNSVQKTRLKNLLDFYESGRLTDSEKLQMQPRLEASKLYLNLMNKTGMANLMFSVVELQAQERLNQLPQKLVNFLSSHPQFTKPFKLDISRDLDILDSEK